MPCRDVSEWKKTNGPPVKPPPIKKKKGRKQTNRRQQLEEKDGRVGRKVGRGGAVIHCSYCGQAGHNIGGCKDFKLGLQPKKKAKKKKVRAEPEVSSSSEDENLATMGLFTQKVTYEAEGISTLIQEVIQMFSYMLAIYI